MSKDRLEAFSDGVFSFVLTLLFIRLTAPQILDHSTLGQYAGAVVPLIPKVVSFVLTFAMICIHWVNHHYFFSHIRRATIELVWLNNLFLLWICFLPFPSSILGDHPTDQFPILLFAVNSLLTALTFYAFRSYASHAKLFKGEKIAEAQGPRHSLPAIIIYGLAILFVFVNVYLSLACFFVIPFLYFVPNLIQGHDKQPKKIS
jgi:uncharacterized membrane protein